MSPPPSPLSPRLTTLHLPAVLRGAKLRRRRRYINLYGCDAYPGGYPMVAKDSPLTSCTNPVALGWIGVFIFLFIIIVGAYVLPTVLIGIVVISFEEASRKSEQMQEMVSKMVSVIGDAREQMPDFFTEGRIEKLRTVFEEIDADGELTLDINEMTPFFEYTFQKVFEVKLTKEQQEQLFHLMDVDGDTELGFAEFVMFVVVIKQIEEKADRDPMFAAAAFPKSFATKRFAAAAGGGAMQALPGSVDAKLSRRNKLGDKGRAGSTPEERRLDAGRSLADVVALAIDSQRIADRVLRDKRGEAGHAVGALVDRLTFELLGAVLGGDEATSLAHATAQAHASRRRPSTNGPNHAHGPSRRQSKADLATAAAPGPDIQFEVSAVAAAVAAEEAWAPQPAGPSLAAAKRYSAAAAGAYSSGRKLSHIGGLFTEASVAGIAPLPGVVAAKGVERWEDAGGAPAAAAAWRKLVKMARADPKGWIRSMEVGAHAYVCRASVLLPRYPRQREIPHHAPSDKSATTSPCQQLVLALFVRAHQAKSFAPPFFLVSDLLATHSLNPFAGHVFATRRRQRRRSGHFGARVGPQNDARVFDPSAAFGVSERHGHRRERRDFVGRVFDGGESAHQAPSCARRHRPQRGQDGRGVGLRAPRR